MSDYEMGYVHRAWWHARDAGSPPPSLDSALAECRRTRTIASRLQESPRHPSLPEPDGSSFVGKGQPDWFALLCVAAVGGLLLLVVGIALGLALAVPH